ncbi:glycosyltransferase family 4 protein [Candidatus Poribacteria bacterium]|nr:glycosyltransferase family 4 protein [Candidatus Poribacteria bacterium]
MKLHLVKRGESAYIANLDRYQLMPVDRLTASLLELKNSHTDGEIIDMLSSEYSGEDILSALNRLKKLSEREEKLPSRKEGRPRILIPEKGTYHADISLHAGGGVIAYHHLIKSMSKRADIFIASDRNHKIDEGIYGVDFDLNRVTSKLSLIEEDYDGILIRSPDDLELLTIFRWSDSPVVIPIYAMRGHGSEMVNNVLLWYSAMRPFDAFVVPTKSVKEFYSRFVLDTDCFYRIPCGVDLEHFKPMDKGMAKREVAKIIGDERVLERPVVGFLSRFQPEKGAGTYIRLARLIPDAIFLVVVPMLNVYALCDFPGNLIYAGRQSRDKLPIFLNAFDILCSASVVGEETFGLAVLEAMACGTPVVVPNFDGFPEVVGDGGVIVEAQTFEDEIGSIAGYVDPEALKAAIIPLLEDETARLNLGLKARKRAENFSWDRVGGEMVNLFLQLKEKRLSTDKSDFDICFVERWNTYRGEIEPLSLLINVTEINERPLMLDLYPQTMLEGLALSLFRKHSLHEVEAVSAYFLKKEEVIKLLKKVKGFTKIVSLTSTYNKRDGSGQGAGGS